MLMFSLFWLGFVLRDSIARLSFEGLEEGTNAIVLRVTHQF